MKGTNSLVKRCPDLVDTTELGEPVWGTLKLLTTPEQSSHRTADPSFPTTFVFSKPVITVGRQKVCDIVFQLPVISGRHCSFHFKRDSGNKVSLKDVSTNGTFVNGELIGKGKLRTLKFGDKIRFGKSTKVQHGADRGKDILVDVYQLCKPLVPFVPVSAPVNFDPRDARTGSMGEPSNSMLDHESVTALCESGEEISFIGSHSNHHIRTTDGSLVISSSRKGENGNLSKKRPSPRFQSPLMCDNPSKRRKGLGALSPDNSTSSVERFHTSSHDDLSGLRSSNRKLQISNDDLRQSLSEQTTKVGNLEKTILELEGNYAKMKKKAEGLEAHAKDETIAIGKKLAVLKEQAESSIFAAERVEKKLKESQRVTSDMKMKCEQVEQERAKLEMSLSEMSSALSQATERALVAEKAAQDEKDLVKEQVEDFQHQITEAKNNASAAEKEREESRHLALELRSELIDAKAQRNNTIELWNSAKEQLEIENGRLSEAFRSLQKATEYFELGISQVHSAKICVEPSQTCLFRKDGMAGLSPNSMFNASSPASSPAMKSTSKHTEASIAPTQQDSGEEVAQTGALTQEGEATEEEEEEAKGKPIVSENKIRTENRSGQAEGVREAEEAAAAEEGNNVTVDAIAVVVEGATLGTTNAPVTAPDKSIDELLESSDSETNGVPESSADSPDEC